MGGEGLSDNQATNKPILGNTLDYYNDDMSRRAVGKLFDDLDDLAPELDLPQKNDELMLSQDTSNIVSGYDDPLSELRGSLASGHIYEPKYQQIEYTHDPAMERAIERASKIAGGRSEVSPWVNPEKASADFSPAPSEREAPPKTGSGHSPRSRAFSDKEYDMGLYRRGQTFINNDEYEELMLPRKRIRETGRNPEPAVIKRSTLKDESSSPLRRRPEKTDSDEYLERIQVHRDHSEMRRAANAYHRSRVLRPYIMGLFLIMVLAMAMMLFRIISLDGRLAEAETKQEELSITIAGNTQFQVENDALKSEIARLEALNEELSRATADTGQPAEEPSVQPEADSLSANDNEFPVSYTVVEGDNLSRISNRFYGNPNYYPQILDANGMTSDAVTPGQTLIIPRI